MYCRTSEECLAKILIYRLDDAATVRSNVLFNPHCLDDPSRLTDRLAPGRPSVSCYLADRLPSSLFPHSLGKIHVVVIPAHHALSFSRNNCETLTFIRFLASSFFFRLYRGRKYLLDFKDSLKRRIVEVMKKHTAGYGTKPTAINEFALVRAEDVLQHV